MPPHLLHVLPGFAPNGAELRLVSILNAIGPGLAHTILALNGDYSAASRLDPALNVQTPPPPPRTSALQYPLVLRKLARSLAPDLILTYNWGATDMLLGARWGSPCPFIHNECGFGPDEAASLKPRRVLARRFLLNSIHTTIVVSESLLAIARDRFRIAPHRLKFIRTGVDTARFHPGRNLELRRALGIPDETPLLGFLGGLRPEKNLSLLVRAYAAADLPQTRLLLIGDGSSRPELEQLTRELNLGDRVLFPGAAADPVPYYHALDVFVLSSATEQTPNALLEAMACGLPCLATDVGDCSAVLDHPGPPCIVPSGDLAAYTAALRVLLDPALRHRHGQANRARAAGHYSHPRMVREYRDTWSNALNRSSSDHQTL